MKALRSKRPFLKPEKVHGHWNYDRMAKLIFYFLFKNISFCMLIFFFQPLSSWSGKYQSDEAISRTRSELKFGFQRSYRTLLLFELHAARLLAGNSKNEILPNASRINHIGSL